MSVAAMSLIAGQDCEKHTQTVLANVASEVADHGCEIITAPSYCG